VALIGSALLGNVSHVLIDIVTHKHSPLFWPFIMPKDMVSPVVSYLGLQIASILSHAILAVLFLPLLFLNRRNLFERLLVG